MVIASRVLLVGRKVERRALRHYLGRVFASLARRSCARRSTTRSAERSSSGPRLRSARSLSDPFVSRWAFDVELLGRLLTPPPGVVATPVGAFLEVPLERWAHVAGGSLRLGGMLRTMLNLAVIARDLGRRRRERI